MTMNDNIKKLQSLQLPSKLRPKIRASKNPYVS